MRICRSVATFVFDYHLVINISRGRGVGPLLHYHEVVHQLNIRWDTDRSIHRYSSQSGARKIANMLALSQRNTRRIK